MASAYPSEAAVVFSDYQQLTSVDLNDAATLPQASLDNAVAAFLAAGQGYTGLPVSANSDALGVTVGTGILYNIGGGFPLRAAAKIDLSAQINLIPDSVSSQIILIVANSGAALISETRTLEDASRKPTNPADLWPTVQQTVTTRNVRAATPSIVPGVVAATNVQVPAYNPLLCLLATVVIDQTGVVSVTQNTAAQITRLDQLAPVVNALANQAAADKVSIATLQDQLLSLAMGDKTQFAALQAQIVALQQALSALDARQTTQAAGATFTQVDYFDNASLSTPTATVGSGLTFPASASNLINFGPLNPLASNLVIKNNKLTLPYQSLNYGTKYRPTQWRAGDVAFNSLNTFSAQPLRKGFGIQHTRYGASLQAQGVSQLLGGANPSSIFTNGALTYDPSWAFWTTTNPELSHQNGFYKDLTGRGFWTPRTPLAPIVNMPGIANRFNSVQPMLTRVGLMLIKGTFGDVRILVCDDLNGAPDFTSVLDDVTVPFASISSFGTNNGADGADTDPNTGTGCDGILNFPISTPIGSNFWVVAVSPGDHKLMLFNPDFSGSTTIPFAGTTLSAPDNNGNWARYAKAAGMGMQVFYPQFTQSPTPIPLQFIHQDGGIQILDFIVPAVIPQGCDLRYALQQADGTLAELGPIASASNGGSSNLLAGNPSTLLPYLIIAGTSGVSPVIDLGTSVSGSAGGTTARQATQFINESPARAPTGVGPFTTITETVIIKGFDPTYHTFTDALETGSSFGTVTPATSVSGPTVQADGTTLITSTFTLSSAVSTWKMKRTGNTSDATHQFTVTRATNTAK